jgi:translation initiation factor IF-2
MSDTDETRRPAKTLSLKKTETSTVKQSFSHGRTKAVVVEKKRSLGAPAAQAKAKAPKTAPKPKAEAPAPAAPKPVQPRGVVLRQLSEEEKARRAAALADAKVSDAEARRIAEREAARRAQEEELLKAEHAAAERRKAEEEARKAADEAAKKRAEQEAARRLEAGAAKPAAGTEAPRRRLEAEEEDDSGKKAKPGAPKVPVPKKVGDGERRRGKLTVTRALSDDDERTRSLASYRRHLQRVNKGHQVQAGPGRTARYRGAGNHHRLRTGQPHGPPHRRCHQGADEERHDGDAGRRARRRYRRTGGHRIWPCRQARRRKRCAGRPDG